MVSVVMGLEGIIGKRKSFKDVEKVSNLEYGDHHTFFLHTYFNPENKM